MPDEKNLPFRECLACDMQEHRFAKTLDHPDGSVTYEKLSTDVKEKINSVGSGGYYIPSVEQGGYDWFVISWAPSDESMKDAAPQTVFLPRENFTAIYQQTTWAELQEAISAGKHICATAGDNVYVMISVSSKNVYFSRVQRASIDYVILNSSGKWSSSSKVIVSKEDFDALVARVAALEGGE